MKVFSRIAAALTAVAAALAMSTPEIVANGHWVL